MDNNGFGVSSCIPRALYEPYILTTSCISGPFKKSVKVMVAKLGGHAISEWRKECQLLVMSNLNVTVKVSTWEKYVLIGVFTPM